MDQITEEKKTLKPISEQIKERRKNQKNFVRCVYCEDDVSSKNFMRHLTRHHSSENKVKELLKLPNKSKQRRAGLILLRKSTNFELYISGDVRPYRKPSDNITNQSNYYPCIYCKGLFKKNYLKRHSIVCIEKPESCKLKKRTDHLSNSQTVVACAIDATETIAALTVKDQVFDKMKGDSISFEAKKDPLIAHFAETYMKKHKRERMVYACSNQMRELSRLLINYRNLSNNQSISFKELIHPKNFEQVLSAVRSIAGYDPIQKSFSSPSLAMHLGTSLKQVCDELTHLILKETKGFTCKTPVGCSLWLKDIKNFKKLLESRWNNEIGSLANKDLQEKKWNKPLLLPLVNDIKTFREECLKIAEESANIFKNGGDDSNTYKLFVNSILALLIVFNRRRIGDVQYLKITDYKKDQKSNYEGLFEDVLTKTEKMLTTKYRRVVNSGKGSRAVVILIPEILQRYIDLLLHHRHKYISTENNYVFATPGSTIPWGKGDVAIRKLANSMQLKNPGAISSNKLRKHIATVMQILHLTPQEQKQFSQFMGHTEKTHEEFYELPIDIYQTAKVSKILIMMEKGAIPKEFKGKSLNDVNFDANLEYAEENDDVDDGVIILKDPQKSHNKVSYDSLNDFPKAGTSKLEKKAKNKRASSDSSDEFSDTNSHKEKKAKKMIKKRGWTDQEVISLKDEFSTLIKLKKYPSSQEITNFINKSKMNRTVAVIKSKLQHLIKLNN